MAIGDGKGKTGVGEEPLVSLKKKVDVRGLREERGWPMWLGWE